MMRSHLEAAVFNHVCSQSAVFTPPLSSFCFQQRRLTLRTKRRTFLDSEKKRKE